MKKKHKYLCVVALSALLIGGASAVGYSNYVPTQTVLAATENNVSLMETNLEGTLRTWTFSGRVTSETKVADTMDNGIYFKASGSSNIKYVKDGKGLSCKKSSSIYIPVPQGSAGRLTMTTYSSSSGRKFTLQVNGVASTKYLWSSKSEGSQYFDFTAEDITNLNGVTYLHIIDNNTEMKVSAFSVSLTTGSYYGQVFDVQFFDGETELTDYTTKVPEGTLINGPKIEKVGFMLAGWKTADGVPFDFATPVTENIQLYAYWTEVQTCTITIDKQDGTAPEVQSVNVNSVLVLPADPAERDGFEFRGWYKEADCNEASKAVAGTLVIGDMTLYAKWDVVVNYYATFMVNDTEYAKAKSIQGFACKTWPENPVGDNHHDFVGWFDEAGVEYTSASILTGDVTLIAKFERKTVETYILENYQMVADANNNVSIVENEIDILGFKKTNTDAPATFDGTAIKVYAQARSIRFTLLEKATVSLYLSQTSSSNARKLNFIDEEGRTYVSTLQPVSKKGNTPVSIVLPAGKYTTLANDLTGMFNYYGLKIDYTNSETLVDGLATMKSMKFENHGGVDAEGNKAVRFVGDIQKVAFEEIAGVSLSVTKRTKRLKATEPVAPVEPTTPVLEGEPTTDPTTPEVPTEPTVPESKYELDANGNPVIDEVTENVSLWTVYSKLTTSDDPNAKFAESEGRFYFYYIVEGLNENYDSVSCTVTVKLSDNSTYTQSSTFVYDSVFAA